MESAGGGNLYNFPLTMSTTQPTAVRNGHIWIKENIESSITKIEVVDKLNTSMINGTLQFVVTSLTTRNISTSHNIKTTSGVNKPISSSDNNITANQWLAGYSDKSSKLILYLTIPVVYSKINNIINTHDVYMYNGNSWIMITSKDLYIMTYNGSSYKLKSYNNQNNSLYDIGSISYQNKANFRNQSNFDITNDGGIINMRNKFFIINKNGANLSYYSLINETNMNSKILNLSSNSIRGCKYCSIGAFTASNINDNICNYIITKDKKKLFFECVVSIDPFSKTSGGPTYSTAWLELICMDISSGNISIIYEFQTGFFTYSSNQNYYHKPDRITKICSNPDGSKIFLEKSYLSHGSGYNDTVQIKANYVLLELINNTYTVKNSNGINNNFNTVDKSRQYDVYLVSHGLCCFNEKFYLIKHKKFDSSYNTNPTIDIERIDINNNTLVQTKLGSLSTSNMSLNNDNINNHKYYSISSISTTATGKIYISFTDSENCKRYNIIVYNIISNTIMNTAREELVDGSYYSKLVELKVNSTGTKMILTFLAEKHCFVSYLYNLSNDITVTKICELTKFSTSENYYNTTLFPIFNFIYPSF